MSVGVDPIDVIDRYQFAPMLKMTEMLRTTLLDPLDPLLTHRNFIRDHKILYLCQVSNPCSLAYNTRLKYLPMTNGSSARLNK
jgi:hypothetical protein